MDAVYIQLAVQQSIGMKRDQAIRRCAGEVVVHWDDDDVYGPQRLRRQRLPADRTLGEPSPVAVAVAVQARQDDSPVESPAERDAGGEPPQQRVDVLDVLPPAGVRVALAVPRGRRRRKKRG